MSTLGAILERGEGFGAEQVAGLGEVAEPAASCPLDLVEPGALDSEAEPVDAALQPLDESR